MYATAADLITRFSAEEIAQRAAPEGVRVTGELLQLTVSGGDRSAFSADQVTAADAALARLNQVIGDANADVDAKVAVRFAAPITTDTGVRTLTRIVCDRARYYLYDDQVDKDGVIQRRFDQSTRELQQIADGELKLGENPEPAPSPVAAGGAQVVGGGRTFSQAQLCDYQGRLR